MLAELSPDPNFRSDFPARARPIGSGMDRDTNLENQRRFVAAKKAQGLRKLVLWVRPEDVEAVQEIACQPRAIAKRHKQVQARIERELRPSIRDKHTRQCAEKLATVTPGNWPILRRD